MWRYRINTVTCTVVVANGDTTGSSTDIPKINGLVRAVYVDAPALDSSTFTVQITGPADGMVLWDNAQGALNAGTQTTIISDATSGQQLIVPVEGACGFTITTDST